MTPRFSVVKRDESMIDFARRGLKEGHAYMKVKRCQLFDVELEAAAPFAEEVYERIIGAFNRGGDAAMHEEITRLGNECGGMLPRWEKHSVFRLWINENEAVSYQCCVMVGRRVDLGRSIVAHRDWAIHATAGKLIQAHQSVNLVEDEINNAGDLKEVATIAAFVITRVMQAVLERPTEYRLSKGTRTPRERMLNTPHVVTISLSKPQTVTVGGGMGGGWKMPEHDVRGHERRYKSGKVVWVSGHKRGDPSVERRTTYRVIP